MTASNFPRRHHHVPEFYLKHFAVDGKVRVQDLINNTAHTTSPKNIAVEKDFYRDKYSTDPFYFEKSLAEREGRFSHCQKQVIASCFLSISKVHLDSSMLQILSEFAILQYGRSLSFRGVVDESRLSVYQELEPFIAKHPLLSNEDEQYLKNEFQRMFGDTASTHVEFLNSHIELEKMMKVLQQHLWYFGIASEKEQFITSDNPVRVSNFLLPNHSSGIASLGVQIFFPLSPRVCWIMLDSRLIKELKGNNFPNNLSLLTLNDSHVAYCNNLQRQQASRQIFATPRSE
jgi:Protein of unknown function (DUF4238)